jgi:hypothetical protein
MGPVRLYKSLLVLMKVAWDERGKGGIRWRRMILGSFGLESTLNGVDGVDDVDGAFGEGRESGDSWGTGDSWTGKCWKSGDGWKSGEIGRTAISVVLGSTPRKGTV